LNHKALPSLVLHIINKKSAVFCSTIKVKQKKERRVNIMKSPKTLFLILIAACFSFAAITDASGTIRKKATPSENTDETKIIRLCSYGHISDCPLEVTVNSGTKIIWINESYMPIKIHFKGKQTIMVFTYPTQFQLVPRPLLTLLKKESITM
jgi:hypothetical protein